MSHGTVDNSFIDTYLEFVSPDTCEVMDQIIPKSLQESHNMG